MSSAATKIRFTPQEYLALERKSETRNLVPIAPFIDHQGHALFRVEGVHDVVVPGDQLLHPLRPLHSRANQSSSANLVAERLFSPVPQ